MKCWKLSVSIIIPFFLVLFIVLYVLVSRYDYNWILSLVETQTEPVGD